MNIKIRKLLLGCSCFCIAFTSIVSAEPRWSMQDVIAEIMTVHPKGVVNYESPQGRPWLKVRDVLTIQDLRIVEVYEQAEELLQQCNDMLEKQKNDPLAHIPLSKGGHPHTSDAKALESVAGKIYDLYLKACAARRATEGSQ